MKIRLATKFDIPEILDMLRNYRDSGIIPGVHDIRCLLYTSDAADE